jgi:hypothetical protein
MSIWSKVLLGFVFLASLGMMVLAAKALKIHQAWQKAGQSYERPLAEKARESRRLVDGDPTTTPPTPGIRELAVQLHALMVDRGRVWQGCTMGAFDQASGSLAADVPALKPGQIQEKMVLYVFAAPEAGGYLGEFTVKAIDEQNKRLQLAPTMQLLPKELDRIRGAGQSLLTIYERMPTDRHEIYAVFKNNKEQLAQWLPGLPEAELESYVRDGQQAGPDDPPDRVVKGKYERPLRDFAVFFHALHGQIYRLKDEIASATTDKVIAEKTRDATRAQVELRTKEIEERLKPELAKVSAERDLIGSHEAALRARLAAVSKEEAGLLAELRKMNKQWTDLQTAAADRLNQVIDREESGGE